MSKPLVLAGLRICVKRRPSLGMRAVAGKKHRGLDL
jgi:hypothetical protein